MSICNHILKPGQLILDGQTTKGEFDHVKQSTPGEVGAGCPIGPVVFQATSHL